MTGFGEIPTKGEGTAISYEGDMKPSKPLVEIEWIEFSLPAHLKDECRKMIKQWLEAKAKENI
jgi:hypothetical protein